MKFATLATFGLQSISAMKIVGDWTEGYICNDLLPLYTEPSTGTYNI